MYLHLAPPPHGVNCRRTKKLSHSRGKEEAAGTKGGGGAKEEGEDAKLSSLNGANERLRDEGREKGF